MTRPMKPIPIPAAKEIAERFGYDQVIIYARRAGEAPDPYGEHMTTYGVDKTHCDVAARIGERLQTELMGWRSPKPSQPRLMAPNDNSGIYDRTNQGG